MASELDMRRTVITTLRANATIQSLVGWLGVYKVFGGDHVDPSVPHPFIMVSHFSGGQDYRTMTPSGDMTFLVVGEALVEDDPEVLDELDSIQQAIHNALHLQKPTLPADLVATYHADNKMREVFPYKERYFRQNRQYHIRGGVYRIVLDPTGS